MAEPPDRSGDPLVALRGATAARIGLGRAGQGLPTAPMLSFQLAHARARDAVHAALDVDRLQADLGLPSLVVDSAAPDRASYLRCPDLGRRLGSAADLARLKRDYDLALVVADGLSAVAAHAHAPALLRALVTQLSGWTLAPVVIARQGRVAIGDAVGQALGARMAVVVIGERPGLSAADGLSAYITFDPKPGRRDSERNCVSNIRTPGGLRAERAAETIAWLLREATRLGFTGVALKDRRINSLDQASAQLPSAGVDDPRTKT